MSRGRDAALFVLLAVLWGGSFPAIEVGLAAFPPLWFAAVRYLAGGALLLAYVAATRGSWRPSTPDDRRAVAAAGVFLVAGNGLLFVGQQYTTGGVAAVIYSLVPVLTTTFAWALLPGERHSRTGLVGVAVGFVGAAVVVSPEPGNLLAASVLGKAVVLLAAASVALGSVLVRREDPALGIAALTAWGMLVGAAVLVPAGALAGESVAAGRPAVGPLLATAYLAVFATAVAFVVYFHLLGTLGPLEVNLVSYVVPVVATGVGWALLAEPVPPSAVAGFALVLVGFALLKRRALAAELRPLLLG